MLDVVSDHGDEPAPWEVQVLPGRKDVPMRVKGKAVGRREPWLSRDMEPLLRTRGHVPGIGSCGHTNRLKSM